MGKYVQLLIVATLIYGDAILCQSPTNGTKIIGGTEISIRFFPWQVAISAQSTHMCGGSILSPTKILSAAHCYASYTQAQLLKFLRVRAGSSSHNERGTVREVIRVVLHPDFNAPTRMNNDIAVLILKSKLDYGPKIQAIALPRAGDRVPDKVELKVSGWGRTRNTADSGPAKRLNFVVVRSIDQATCANAFKNLQKHKFTDRMFCAGILNVGGKDACQGDSGGPIVRPLSPPVLVGVVSWGIECADKRYPGVYALVSLFIDWINKTN